MKIVYPEESPLYQFTYTTHSHFRLSSLDSYPCKSISSNGSTCFLHFFSLKENNHSRAEMHLDVSICYE